MTNADVEKKKEKDQNHKSYTEVNMKEALGNKRVFTKTTLTYGKDVTCCVHL